MEFSETLKELRLRSGLSQNEVCKKLGISQQRLSTWETGRSMPTGDAFLRLVRLYNVENIMEAFGYVTTSDELIKPTPYELSLIKRLRTLDSEFYNSIVGIIDYAYELKQRADEMESLNSEEKPKKKPTIQEILDWDEPELLAAHGSEGMTEEELEEVHETAKRLKAELKRRKAKND